MPGGARDHASHCDGFMLPMRLYLSPRAREAMALGRRCEASMKWKIGDVVKLKTGGSKMTVNRQHPTTESVECAFFDFDVERGWKGPTFATFHQDTLVDGEQTEETVQ